MRLHHSIAALSLLGLSGFTSKPMDYKAQPLKWHRPRRNRYMPHIGAKERARHAGKPDGPMHKKGSFA